MFAKRMAKSIVPSLIKAQIKKIAYGMNNAFAHSDENVRSDEYISWLCWVMGGFLTPEHGNLRAFDHAVRNMPDGGAILEIGSFLGLSTNIIAYLAIKYHRDNIFFTCDPWVFEETDKLVGGYFESSSNAFREYVKKTFVANVVLFSEKRKPYSVEVFSDKFFELWSKCSMVDDVFERPITLGGPISFAYIDGAHTYNAAKGDFLGVAKNLLPGGFILFDDSADGSGWEVTQVVAEVRQDPSYELIFASPNYLFRKRIS
jgi:hypothetical protein